MKQRVVAIGLDAADPDLLQSWISAGHLPNIKKLRESGLYCRFENKATYTGGTAPYSSTEGSWVALQTGMKPSSTGYWETVDYNCRTYDTTSDPVYGGYDYSQFPPFFALGDDYKVVAFDVPVTAVCPDIKGKQIVGWGGHFPFVQRGSEPSDLLETITKKYGKNKVLYKDYGVFWKPKYLRWLEKSSIESIKKRTRICLDLLKNEQWDLFLAVFGETHGAAHDLWFASRSDHPVHKAWKGRHNPLLNVYNAIDEALGEISRQVPDDTYFTCFSAHGMQSNQTDLTNFFLLPEIMYRHNFPGRIGFAGDDSKTTLREPFLGGRHWYWFGEIWRRKYNSTKLGRKLQTILPGWLVWPTGNDLKFPYFLDWFGPEAGWIPAVWYRPAWPSMRSFALPSFADGHVRINLAGRDAHGLVRADEYEAECNRITELLLSVRHGRTGKAIVQNVIRTRKSAHHEDPLLPHADLIIIWEDDPVDVIESNDVGRIGPVPYYRTGGHRNAGFMLARGPGITAGKELPTAEVIDFGPTILAMLGASAPDRLEGKSLLPKSTLASV